MIWGIEIVALAATCVQFKPLWYDHFQHRWQGGGGRKYGWTYGDTIVHYATNSTSIVKNGP